MGIERPWWIAALRCGRRPGRHAGGRPPGGILAGARSGGRADAV